MKAIIVECSNGAAVALCEDGSFKRLKNNGFFIGQELLLKQKASANRIVQKLSICASLALVLLSAAGIGSYSYAKPYSFVSLDINPSIEYALNRYDKVIAVSGINDKGQKVVSSIESDVKNQNITTALDVTIRQLEKDNYIVQKEYNHVIVSVCSDNDSKAKSIASRVNTFSAEESQVCAIDAMAVSKAVKSDADSLGITPGKLALIQAVAVTTSASDFNVSEWTEKTVTELEDTLKQANGGTSGYMATVINGEYLSNFLDDNTAQKADSIAAASQAEADKLTGSTSTDQQKNNNNDTTAGSNAGTKSDNAGNTATPAATDSTGKLNAAGTVAANNSGTAGSANGTTSQDASAKPSEKGSLAAGTFAKPSDSDKDGSGNKDLTEDTSGKKDSYVATDAGLTGDTSNSQKGEGNPSTDGSGQEVTASDAGSDSILAEETSGKKDPYVMPGAEENVSDSPEEQVEYVVTVEMPVAAKGPGMAESEISE